MAPGLQNHPAIERLSFRCDHQTIVLAPCAGVRFAPVKSKRFEFQGVKRKKQVLRPLVTVAALPEPVEDEEVVKNRRAEHAVLSPELAHSCVSAICQQLCFRPIHPWRKCHKVIGQRFRLGQIAPRHLESPRKLLRLLTGTGEAGRPKRKYGNYAGEAMHGLTLPPLIPPCDAARRAESSLVDINPRLHLQESLRETAVLRVYASLTRWPIFAKQKTIYVESHDPFSCNLVTQKRCNR